MKEVFFTEMVDIGTTRCCNKNICINKSDKQENIFSIEGKHQKKVNIDVTNDNGYKNTLLIRTKIL